MNKYLTKYALLNKEIKNNGEIKNLISTTVKTPTLQYIVFGIIMCVLGYLMGEKILPFS